MVKTFAEVLMGAELVATSIHATASGRQAEERETPIGG
jgi:hypothetical protein